MEKTDITKARPCSCGRIHECATAVISIGEDQTGQILDYIRQNFGGASKGCVICDYNTYTASENMIKALGGLCQTVKLDIGSCHADEYMVEQCEKALENKNFDYFIAAGAGTLHDITRLAAQSRNSPFISYPTAASVDGFVSGISPLTSKTGMKLTIFAAAPTALFADTKVIEKAPVRLLAAGAGDVLGKYTALADWRMANLLTGEHICDPIVELEYQTVEKFRESLAAFGDDKSEKNYSALCAALIEALVKCGLYMQYTGNSRPASGAEHHIAHFFEMNVILSTDCLHGENVGLGTVMCAELYRRFAEADDLEFIENYGVEHELIKKYYKGLYESILEENAENSVKQVTPGRFYGSLGAIRDIISSIPPKEELIKLLDILGGVTTLPGIKAYNLKCEKAEIEPLAFRLAPYVRDRLTLLKLMRCVKNYV
ncbi:MAG: iron-containing alcohol dehydrogenase [Oscillospiraceae bacterium]|nr:iron-containing alcohol dehydrogenase [Oscillospiraceae bacterium]